MLSLPLRQGNAMQAPQGVDEAWGSGLNRVLADDRVPQDIRDTIQAPADGRDLAAIRAQINVASAEYERHGNGRLMTKARPVVDGLLRLGGLGTQLATCDPHGIAGLVWGISQILLKGMDKYYKRIEEAQGLVDRMERVIPRFRKWEKPAESDLFSQSLKRVFENYAQFCVTFVAFLHGQKHSLGLRHRTKSEEVAKYVEAVERECGEAVQDAQAAAAYNNAAAHDETHRALNDLVRDTNALRDITTSDNQMAHKWQIAVDELHQRLRDVQTEIKSEMTSNEQQTEEIENMRNELARLYEQQTREAALEKHRNFLGWIGCTDTRATANAKAKARNGLAQTGSWIYDDPILQPWLSKAIAERPVLWLTADPGFGKSCLAVRIIQDIGGLDSQGVAWFFCTGNSVQAILQTWLHQLLRLKNGKSHLELPESFGDFRANGDRSVKALCDMLAILFEQRTRTILIVDGLDECRVESGDVEQEFRAMFSLFSNMPKEWKLLLVSRNNTFFNPWLEEELDGIMVHKIITREDTHADLQTYSRHELKKLVHAKGGGWDDRLVHDSEKLLQEKASGMFMWVSLVSNQVQRDWKKDEDGSRFSELLEGQPEKLQDIYENELKALFRLFQHDNEAITQQDVERMLRAVR